MPNSVLVTTRQIIEHSAVVLTARVRKVSTGAPVVPADVASAHLRVYDVTANPPELVTPTGGGGGYAGTNLTVASVFLSALATDYLAEDDTGYNFKHELHGSHFPTGGRKYQVEVKVTPASGGGDPYYMLWQFPTVPVYSE